MIIVTIPLFPRGAEDCNPHLFTMSFNVAQAINHGWSHLTRASFLMNYQ